MLSAAAIFSTIAPAAKRVDPSAPTACRIGVFEKNAAASPLNPIGASITSPSAFTARLSTAGPTCSKGDPTGTSTTANPSATTAAPPASTATAISSRFSPSSPGTPAACSVLTTGLTTTTTIVRPSTTMPAPPLIPAESDTSRSIGPHPCKHSASITDRPTRTPLGTRPPAKFQ